MPERRDGKRFEMQYVVVCRDRHVAAQARVADHDAVDGCDDHVLGRTALAEEGLRGILRRYDPELPGPRPSVERRKRRVIVAACSARPNHARTVSTR
jgi:hypothetical protein